MAETKQIYFHQGLPKAASTFLQRKVFPKFKNIRFVKKHHFKNHQAIIEKTKADKVLLSIELDLDVAEGKRKLNAVANRYPGTKPIFVLRKHSSWLRSKYKYYLRKHGEADFENYFDFENNNGVLKKEQLNFFQKIQLIEAVYKTRPLVMFFNELTNNARGFVNVIADFTGAEYNPDSIKTGKVKKSYSNKQFFYVKKFNRWYHFDNEKFSNKIINRLYKKFSAFLLHFTAYLACFFPGQKSQKTESLIPADELRKVDQAFAEDWKKCVEYAKQDRQLLM